MARGVKKRQEGTEGESLPQVQFTVHGVVETLESIISQALSSMTPESLAATKPRDLAQIVGLLIQQRQLLKGEPTAIVDDRGRRQMDGLVRELFKEAKRRGLGATVIDVTPESPEGGEDGSH